MKTKIYVILIVFALTSFLLFSCNKIVLTKCTLEVPKVNLTTCLPSFAGSESISLRPTFTITNPNSFLLEINIDYQLESGKQLLGKSMIATLYVPPNQTIEINDTVVIAFKGWFASQALGGRSKKEAIMIVTPIWKGMGGKRPAVIPESLWKKIPEKKLPIIAKGSILTTAKATEKMFHFEVKWQE